MDENENQMQVQEVQEEKVVNIFNPAKLQKRRAVTFNLEYEVGDKVVKKSVKDVQVVVTNGLTVDSVIALVNPDFPAYDEEERAAYLANVEIRAVEGVVKLVNDQLLQHQGSGATKAQATRYAKGLITRDELDKFVYTHDYTKRAEKKDPAQTMKEKFEKLSPEERAMLLALLSGKGKSDEEEEDESAGE